ncbi:MAG TPA: histidine kinase [Acidimicrobiales bacterium]|nr:histidine kinase [Acidimicrobiales bacterium]
MGFADMLHPAQGTRSARMLTLARLGGLAAVLWGVAHQVPHGTGAHVAVAVLGVTASAGWIGWMASRRFEAAPAATWVALAVLAVSGGVLSGYAPVALTYVAVGALGAGVTFDAGRAAGVGGLGVAAVATAVLALGTASPGEIIAEGGLAAVAGLMAGASRRQYLGRAQQAEQLLAERVRADAERDRAAALAERNRLGREIHDVLAHSLGALAVQLGAADALLEQGHDADQARDLVRQARSLAVRGLEETRQAVHALRDQPVELTEQLASLAAHEGAELTVDGSVRPLTADAGLALYRAAQEALSNARKHAPGAPVGVRLSFEPERVSLLVTNGAHTELNGDLRETGGGFGLQGMRERVELLGGRVEAGPGTVGWRVHVAVPA